MATMLRSVTASLLILSCVAYAGERNKDVCMQTDNLSIAKCAELVLENKRVELADLEKQVLDKQQGNDNKKRFGNNQAAWQAYRESTLQFYREGMEKQPASGSLKAAHLIFVETSLVDHRIRLLKCMKDDKFCAM